MNMRLFPLVLAGFLALCLSSLGAESPQTAFPALPGDLSAKNFPDNVTTRKNLRDKLVCAPMRAVLAAPQRFYNEPQGLVAVSSLRRNNDFFIVFANVRGGKPVTYSQGSWVIKRSALDGSFIQAKIFLRSDPGIFARLYPFEDRTKLEIIVYGAVIYLDVLIPEPFESVISMPFSRIMQETKASVDWDIISPSPADYAEESSLVESARAFLPQLAYGEDGAINSQGQAVYIRNGKTQSGKPVLNCSGFVKWLIDAACLGLKPEAPLSDISTLKRHGKDARGPEYESLAEDPLDLRFGLDWIKNLRVYYGKGLGGENSDAEEDNDVTITPFALLTDSGDVLNTHQPYTLYPDFLPAAGYKAEGLKALLYLMAVKKPGNFYLGAISREKQPGNDPALRQYYHVAAFFPYFTAGGVFKVSVLESCVENNIDAVISRINGEFVYLVSFPSSSAFDGESALGNFKPSPSPEADQDLEN
jgi:hypothetical protein